MLQNFSDLTYGADPEVFAVNDQKFVYSPGILEHWGKIHRVADQKKRFGEEILKHPIFIDGGKYWWIMDGVAFELTLTQPYKNPGEMAMDCMTAKNVLSAFISNIEVGKENLELYTKSVVNINPEVYIPHLVNEVVYQGFIFGCDPDSDVTEEDYVCHTEDVTTHKFRYGGGHFHFGGNPDQRDLMHKNWFPFVKLLAMTVGNICVAESVCPDEDRQRVGKYGRPGRYRLPPHGVEYRSPSNAWMNNLAGILPKVFRAGAIAFDWLWKENSSVIDKYFAPTCDAINTVNQDLSRQVLKDMGVE
jgi:hypothetical protein